MEYNVNVTNFKNLLLEENKKQNLVSRRSIYAELDKHIEDSRQLLEHMPIGRQKVIDIGSGAGFPGMILALDCPQAEFTLVESDLKKSRFLKRVVAELNLTNVEVIRNRVEELGRELDYREQFDICTCRAVASMNVILEYGFPLLKVGGKMVQWKGINYQQEIGEAQNALRLLRAEVSGVVRYTLMEDRDRALVVVKKLTTTPEEYPRRTGIPTKRPL
ncbi:16S rRNA (guanine(527)-N(7))-methyltransferase RsmG [Syntrophomonas erecta]